MPRNRRRKDLPGPGEGALFKTFTLGKRKKSSSPIEDERPKQLDEEIIGMNEDNPVDMATIAPSARSLLPPLALNCYIKDKDLLKEASCYKSKGKKGGRPRVIHNDDTIFSGAMYANAAHFLFNKVVLKEGKHRGKSGFVKMVESTLEDTIWDLVRHSEEEKKTEKRERAVRKEVSEAFSAKRQKGGANIQWSIDLKAIAVEEVFLSVPDDLRSDPCAWKDFIPSAVSQLKLRSVNFKNITIGHLRGWYERFYNYIELRHFDFDENDFLIALEDKRGRNSNAAIVPDELRKLLIELILEVVAQKIEINITILRPFLLKFIRDKDAFSHILNGGGGRKAFMACCTWIRDLMKESKLSYRKNHQ